MWGYALAGLWKEFAEVPGDSKSFCKQILPVHAETSHVFLFFFACEQARSSLIDPGCHKIAGAADSPEGGTVRPGPHMSTCATCCKGKQTEHEKEKKKKEKENATFYGAIK